MSKYGPHVHGVCFEMPKRFVCLVVCLCSGLCNKRPLSRPWCMLHVGTCRRDCDAFCCSGKRHVHQSSWKEIVCSLDPARHTSSKYFVVYVWAVCLCIGHSENKYLSSCWSLEAKWENLVGHLFQSILQRKEVVGDEMKLVIKWENEGISNTYITNPCSMVREWKKALENSYLRMTI